MSDRVAIIGAGPSGLTAAYELARRGTLPVILERTEHVGGLMRSLRHEDFTLDIGRKELYARIPEVRALWETVLDGDFIPYSHRVGSLFEGRIIEISGEHRGVLRGVPVPLLIRGGASLVKGRVAGLARKPRTFEQHWQRRVGRVFSEAFAQGYWEKFRGTRWADMPVPAPAAREGSASYSQSAIRRAFRLGGRDARTATDWRHPRFGTGQLFDALRTHIEDAGGNIAFNSEVASITRAADGTWHLAVRGPKDEHTIEADHVISSLPLDVLAAKLHLSDEPHFQSDRFAATAELAERRHVLLVYLFSDEPPKFPHACLEVNDQALRCGRITNYSAFGGGMVPDGKTCLCVEFFCSGDDPMLGETDDQLVRRALAECGQADLFHASELLDSRVLRLERTNAAASWREQQEESRRDAFRRLRALKTFYHVSRPGSDWASFAGLLAAQAILTKDRTAFDTHADPSRRLEERGGAAAS